MTPEDLLTNAIVPALKELGGTLESPGAAVFLLAWCLQESGTTLTARVQAGRKLNPALGLPQLEHGEQAMTALVVKKYPEFREWLLANGYPPDDSEVVRQAARDDDRLAMIIARLGAYASSKPMPAVGDAQAAWVLYFDTARPGRPRPEKWPANYERALAAWKARGLKPIAQSKIMGAATGGSSLSIAGIVWAAIEAAAGRNIEPLWVMIGLAVIVVAFVVIGVFRLDNRLKGLS